MILFCNAYIKIMICYSVQRIRVHTTPLNYPFMSLPMPLQVTGIQYQSYKVTSKQVFFVWLRALVCYQFLHPTCTLLAPYLHPTRTHCSSCFFQFKCKSAIKSETLLILFSLFIFSYLFCSLVNQYYLHFCTKTYYNPLIH